MSNDAIIASIKLSFVKDYNTDTGNTHDQRLRMDNSVFERLRDAVDAEIAFQFPRKKEYVFTSGYEIFLKPLKRAGNFCFINHTQRRFINLFLKLPLKDRNTSIKID